MYFFCYFNTAIFTMFSFSRPLSTPCGRRMEYKKWFKTNTSSKSSLPVRGLRCHNICTETAAVISLFFLFFNCSFHAEGIISM